MFVFWVIFKGIRRIKKRKSKKKFCSESCCGSLKDRSTIEENHDELRKNLC